MLNKLWPILIVISVFFSIFVGRVSELNSAIFISLEDTVTFVLKFLGIMCFWNGMIAVLRKTSIVDKIGKLLRPIICFFFSKESEDVKELITINMISNLIGIGNAATPTRYSGYEKNG